VPKLLLAEWTEVHPAVSSLLSFFLALLFLTCGQKIIHQITVTHDGSVVYVWALCVTQIRINVH